MIIPPEYETPGAFWSNVVVAENVVGENIVLPCSMPDIYCSVFNDRFSPSSCERFSPVFHEWKCCSGDHIFSSVFE